MVNEESVAHERGGFSSRFTLETKCAVFESVDFIGTRLTPPETIGDMHTLSLLYPDLTPAAKRTGLVCMHDCYTFTGSGTHSHQWGGIS